MPGCGTPGGATAPGFALALWNGNDATLKERLFGLTNSEGNHGEDVKEYHFYLAPPGVGPGAPSPHLGLACPARLRPASDWLGNPR